MNLPRLPFRLPSISPIARITIGLVSLSLSLIIGFDIAFGLFPKETDTARQIRQRISQSLAVQATMGLGDKDFAKLERLLTAVVKRDPDLLSAGLRKEDGTLRLSAGPHILEWKPVDPSRSTLEHVSIPMFDQDKLWGRLELSYRPVGARDGAEWLQTPSIKLFAVFLVMGSTVFYFYLRRVLQKLDPSKAVPDRVRLAFDTLSEGLLILDGAGRVMMVNQSLLTISGVENSEVLGKTVDQLPWLRAKEKAASDSADVKNPWAIAIRERRFVQGIDYEVRQSKTRVFRLIANYAPILDGARSVRGCMVTFNDVTEIEKTNSRLMETLADLASNKEALQSKNVELERLASRDPMTGCLNRRVFYERFERLYADAKRRNLEISCIMGDIDKFKLVNDTFGHQAGDQVIRSFASILQSAVRGEDLVGRYGGEEFCIVLIGATPDAAVRLAERIRRTVELECGAVVPEIKGRKITCSLGVSSIQFASNSATAMVNEADQALYSAKQSGRNRVVNFGTLAELVV